MPLLNPHRSNGSILDKLKLFYFLTDMLTMTRNSQMCLTNWMHTSTLTSTLVYSILFRSCDIFHSYLKGYILFLLVMHSFSLSLSPFGQCCHSYYCISVFIRLFWEERKCYQTVYTARDRWTQRNIWPWQSARSYWYLHTGRKERLQRYERNRWYDINKFVIMAHNKAISAPKDHEYILVF